MSYCDLKVIDSNREKQHYKTVYMMSQMIRPLPQALRETGSMLKNKEEKLLWLMTQPCTRKPTAKANNCIQMDMDWATSPISKIPTGKANCRVYRGCCTHTKSSYAKFDCIVKENDTRKETK
ncbi:hypothetical protein E3N88_46165 [Mikania micrantha]|uniref:Uncharacterized protein n=1 Tax=Mikania micrantha TaxID=192012 RepID=A0A5N6L733_9ASTR|nr:hypothetical protein E3N88_46165 [Mikania micrantha]